MSASTRTFTVVHVAPVPVGHRVEIRFFEAGRGLFSKAPKVARDAPLITDLDTGVVYGSHWHYVKSAGIASSAFDPDTPPADVRPDLVTAEVVTGRVVSCRLVTVMGGTTWRVQTTLDVAI